MELKWTEKSISDLARLYEFLASKNQPAAARAVQALTRAPRVLLSHPRMGDQLFQFAPREVRRILVGHYEVRYEIVGETLHILRLWHTLEER